MVFAFIPGTEKSQKTAKKYKMNLLNHNFFFIYSVIIILPVTIREGDTKISFSLRNWQGEIGREAGRNSSIR